MKTGDIDDLHGHPNVGGSWEGFVIEQIRQLKPQYLDIYFYRTHQGTEADLILAKGQKPVACIEIKLSTSPQISKGFYQAIADLKTLHNFVIIPNGEAYVSKEKTKVVSLSDFVFKHLAKL